MWIPLEAKHLNRFKNSFKETCKYVFSYILDDRIICSWCLNFLNTRFNEFRCIGCFDQNFRKLLTSDPNTHIISLFSLIKEYIKNGLILRGFDPYSPLYSSIHDYFFKLMSLVIIIDAYPCVFNDYADLLHHISHVLFLSNYLIFLRLNLVGFEVRQDDYLRHDILSLF